MPIARITERTTTKMPRMRSSRSPLSIGGGSSSKRRMRETLRECEDRLEEPPLEPLATLPRLLLASAPLSELFLGDAAGFGGSKRTSGAGAAAAASCEEGGARGRGDASSVARAARGAAAAAAPARLARAGATTPAAADAAEAAASARRASTLALSFITALTTTRATGGGMPASSFSAPGSKVGGEGGCPSPPSPSRPSAANTASSEAAAPALPPAAAGGGKGGGAARGAAGFSMASWLRSMKADATATVEAATFLTAAVSTRRLAAPSLSRSELRMRARRQEST